MIHISKPKYLSWYIPCDYQVVFSKGGPWISSLNITGKHVRTINSYALPQALNLGLQGWGLVASVFQSARQVIWGHWHLRPTVPQSGQQPNNITEGKASTYPKLDVHWGSSVRKIGLANCGTEAHSLFGCSIMNHEYTHFIKVSRNLYSLIFYPPCKNSTSERISWDLPKEMKWISIPSANSSNKFSDINTDKLAIHYLFYGNIIRYTK